MNTANLTDDQVVDGAAAILVMPSVRVRQLLDEIGYFTLRSHFRDEIQSKKEGPAEKPEHAAEFKTAKPEPSASEVVMPPPPARTATRPPPPWEPPHTPAPSRAKAKKK